MGSQQLMIIVLVVFVVGLSIVTGIRLVASFNQSNERDMILVQMQTVVGEAKKYYAKPKSIGGGEGSFVGFEPPARFTSTDRIRLYMTIGNDWILFQGFGNVVGWDGVTTVQLVAQYDQPLQDWSSITPVN
ncbi:MAG: hypothetical protein HY563_02640 [Ignavibacteriales bacterium]|nr:hypothetical protein [Ignavibacteriales bacterium]